MLHIASVNMDHGVPALNLQGSADEVEPGDWIAGYIVGTTSTAEHEHRPATRMSLFDSLGDRNVGRLVLQNDALRDAALEFIRPFDTDDERDAFISKIENKGFGMLEARMVEVGDLVRIDSITGEVSELDFSNEPGEVTLFIEVSGQALREILSISLRQLILVSRE